MARTQWEHRSDVETYDAPVRHEGYEVDERQTRSGNGLRVFQVVTGLAGAVLFVAGLVAVFRVDFGAGFFETNGDVAGFGFSPALAVAAIVLGGATLIAALSDQDRGAAGLVGLITLLAGIAALVLEGEVAEGVSVDRRSAGLFVVIGAVVFVMSLVPWWTGRQRRTVVR